jgi:hypothetical protein
VFAVQLPGVKKHSRHVVEPKAGTGGIDSIAVWYQSDSRRVPGFRVCAASMRTAAGIASPAWRFYGKGFIQTLGQFETTSGSPFHNEVRRLFRIESKPKRPSLLCRDSERMSR